MQLNFKTRINGEKFFNLLQALGGSPDRKGNEFYISTGDYWDCVQNLECEQAGIHFNDEEENERVARAIADFGKPIDLLIDWLKAVYFVHERSWVYMKFAIN